MAKKAKFTEEDDALLAELGVEVEVKQPKKYNNKEQRIIAGFEEIQKFVEEHGRLPTHGEDKDIFERLYAVRLDRIRAQEECTTLLQELDHQGLLTAAPDAEFSVPDDMEDDELLAQLGVAPEGDSSITKLRHVKSNAEKKAAEEIANRDRCEDFERFRPLFDRAKRNWTRASGKPFNSGKMLASPKPTTKKDNSSSSVGKWPISPKSVTTSKPPTAKKTPA
jgi:hypothetical protein